MPPCPEVRGLGRLGGRLLSATRPQAVPLGYPPAHGSTEVTVRVPQSGEYTAWLAGDWFGDASISVDGNEVGSRREELNWPGLYTDLGTVQLDAGEHRVTLRNATGGWRPGSGGTPFSFGPAALSLEDARAPVEGTGDPRSLCGRRLDWVEAVR